MPRKIRSSQLETRTARLKLAPRARPYAVRIGDGTRLGYRRLARIAGSWSVQIADGKGGASLKRFADADDYQEANGDTVLDFWQAQDRAQKLAQGSDGRAGGGSPRGTPITVAAALDAYEADLRIRGGDGAAVPRVRLHLPRRLQDAAVADLTARELRHFRDSLAKKRAPGTVDRIGNALRAALNLAADTDSRITSRRAWEVGLKGLYDAVEARNVILPDVSVRAIVDAAYAVSPEFGLLVEVVASTGARVVSQVARLEVADLQAAPWRLLMPSSKKGRGQKKVLRRPVPIPESLAIRLRQAAQGRPDHAPLLTKSSGEPWCKSDHTRLFRRAAEGAGLDPAEVTIYALRHSSVVRQLLANVPIRVVAVNHDTSVPMIEKTYSKYIGDHSDAMTRAALLDLGTPAPTSKVVQLPR
jgi:Phage integrase family